MLPSRGLGNLIYSPNAFVTFCFVVLSFVECEGWQASSKIFSHFPLKSREECFMSIGGQSDSKSDQRVYRLTPEGYAKMRERLDYLRTVKRKEIADYIHEAKEAGDISESSAYEDAKNEQAKVEGEILQLERLLEAAEIMTPDMHDTPGGPPVVRRAIK